MTGEVLASPLGYGGPTVLYDVLDPNPLVSYSVAVYGGNLQGEPAPTMFAGGDLPPFTSSGVDPEVLARIPWSLRHAAAQTTDRAAVYAMAQAHPDDLDRHQTVEGAAAVEEYRGRVLRWTAGTAF